MPAAPERWRCFVAVPITASLRRDLASAVAGWRTDPKVPDLRWTDPDGWHLTLAFLGSTDPERVPGLADALRATASSLSAFSVPAGGVGAFPRPKAASVLWYRIDDPERRLAELATRVQQAVELEPERRPFRGHLTVARSRDRAGVPLDGWLPGLASPHATIPVREVILFRSRLGRGPARYEALATARLGKAPSGHD